MTFWTILGLYRPSRVEIRRRIQLTQITRNQQKRDAITELLRGLVETARLERVLAPVW